MQTTLEAPSVPLETARFGGFLIRFGALIIDYLILSFLQFVIIAPIMAAIGFSANPGSINPDDAASVLSAFMGAMGLVQFIGFVIGFLYFVLMESSSKQGTLGKIALGLIVVDQDGMRLSFGKAALRYVGKIVSFMTFFIGFIMAAFTERNKALHDMIAGTYVIKK